ncbi:MAG: ATP-binding cassette domain-containing protein [Clostridia bacterium]|nr:ATP-binding cassette domain-containing protein [Clostridia bacterium]
MITLKNVTKKYGGLTVYDGFNFDICEGQITCILGESGSGKTTLLNMLANLTPYEGEITNKSCSYIFQSPRLLPNLTVRGNLSLVCKDRAAVDDMIEAVGLKDKAGSYPVTLSGGQAQRAAIARAFLYPSEVILMDEPFSSLDLALKLKMAELFLSLWKGQRRTAVFVTHDADEALMLANRIAVLKGGKVKEEFFPEGEPCADLFARSGQRQKLLACLMD